MKHSFRLFCQRNKPAGTTGLVSFLLPCDAPVKMNAPLRDVGLWWGIFALLAACCVHTTWEIDTFWYLTKQCGALCRDSQFEIQYGDNCCYNDFSVIQYANKLQHVPRLGALARFCSYSNTNPHLCPEGGGFILTGA